MRVMRLLCLFLVIAAVIASFIVNDTQNAAAENKLRVVILVYSGRADDPSYQLANPRLVAQVKDLIGKARKTKFKGKTIIPSILGYRGIIVQNPGRISGLPEHFAVYKGIIEIIGKKKIIGKKYPCFTLKSKIEEIYTYKKKEKHLQIAAPSQEKGIIKNNLNKNEIDQKKQK